MLTGNLNPIMRRAILLSLFVARLLTSGAQITSHPPCTTVIKRTRPGLAAVTNIEALPLLYDKGAETRQFSSFDPSGSNNDGNFVTAYTKYIDKNGEYVIFDATGPGCLYRQQYNIWYTRQFIDAGTTHIKYYFDNEKKARIDVPINDFFSGKIHPFISPFAFLDSQYRFGVMYYPLPFKSRLKITTTFNLNTLSKSDAPYDAAWYQYTYHVYNNPDSVITYTPEDTLNSATIIGQWQQKGKDPKLPAGDTIVTKDISLDAGHHSDFLKIEGKGAITSLRLSLNPYNRDVFYHTHVRIFWDNNKNAAVDMPLANFFGGGGESYKNCQDIFSKSLSTLMFGYNGEVHEFYSFWPMPYWQSARIELWNDSQTDIQNAVLTIGYKTTNKVCYPESTTGYFFARRTIVQDTGRGMFASIFKENGRGHVVGLSFYSSNYAMDGDEFTYIDGSHTPQMHGDGTEDDHNQGWGGDAYQFPLWGGVVNGYQGAYRLYLNDAYIFNRDIRINYEYSREGGQDYGGQVDAVVYYYKSSTPSSVILSDVVDPGNSISEKKHHYRLSGKTWRKEVLTSYDGYERNYQYDRLQDTGYAYNGFSEFDVSIGANNDGVRLRRRIYRSGNGIQRALVYVNGKQVRERQWDICAASSAPFYQGWYDADFEIPSFYTKGKNSIHLRIEYTKGDGSGDEINEFFYWVYTYQGKYEIKQGKDNESRYKEPTREIKLFKTGAAPSIAAAKFVNIDTLTKGLWPGKYGSEGFLLLQYFFGRNCEVQPAYISKVDYGSLKGVQFSSWYNSTISSLNASPINPTKKYLGAYYTFGSDAVSLYVNNDKKHRLAVYVCDYDDKGRRQKIEVVDLKDNILAPAIELDSFKAGKWLNYEFSGNIRIRIVNQSHQSNAVISALLFDNM